MKIAIWIYTLAVMVACYATAVVSMIFERLIRQHNPGNLPLAPITQLYVQMHWYAFLFAVPIVLWAAWLSTRSSLSAGHAVAFGGGATLTITLLFAFAAVALPLGFLWDIRSLCLR